MEQNLALSVADHDLIITASGQLALTQNTVDLLSQRLTCRFRMFSGEWYLDREAGVPYFREVMKKNPSIPRVRALLLSVAATTKGVDKILAFDVSFNPATRIFSVNFKVRATDGTIVEGAI